jgi:tetratricopeptide (TPR) repeat protein
VPGRVASSRRTERVGVNALRSLLEEHDQIVQEINGGNDYGEDLLVMLTRDGERTGVTIAVQVKSGSSYRRGSAYAIPVGAHAGDWRDALVPVFGVVFDVELRQLFWVNLTQALESAEQAPSRILVSRLQELDESSIASFLDQAHAFVEARSKGHSGETTLQVTLLSATTRSASAWFVGRDRERQVVKEAVTGGAMRRVLVSGMAGVGKTSLLDQVVADPDIHAVFSGGVILADMYGFSPNRHRMARPGPAYAPLLSVLGVRDEEIPQDLESQAARYHLTLDALATAGTPALLVFDNVADLSQVAELLPRADAHGVVLTSRTRLGVIDGIQVVTLECLESSQSHALIGQALGAGDDRLLDPAQIQKISELCGHLPLALSICAAIMKEDRALAACELLAELAEEKTRLDVLQFADTAVRAALQVSLTRLDASLHLPFCLLSVHPTSDMPEQAAASVLGLEGPRARPVLRRLHQAGLISPAPTARWRMHDLVHLFAAEQCRASIAQEQRLTAFRRLTRLYIEDSEHADLTLRGTPRGAPPRFATPGDALAWFDIECFNLQATARQARDLGMTAQTFALSMNPLLFFDLRGRTNDALRSVQTAYEAALLEGDAEQQVRALNNVSATLIRLRRFTDAARTLTEGLALAESTGYLDGQIDLTTTLGSMVRQAHSPIDAIPILEEAVQLAQRTGDPGALGTALTNLASAYNDTGLPAPAAQAYSRSIPHHQASKDRRKEASAHAGLAAALSQLGQADQALQSFQAAFTAYQELQDESGIHLNLLNHGSLQLKMGRLQDARISLQQALDYFQRHERPHEAALALANLGNLEWTSDNPRAAVQHFKAALRQFRELGDLANAAHVERILHTVRSGPARPL